MYTKQKPDAIEGGICVFRKLFATILIVCALVIVANAETVLINELNISFKVPDWLEWATRDEGNYEIMKKTYHMDQTTLIKYMETGGEYFKGVDPNSNLRVFMACYPANYTEKNYTERTDAEILDAGTIFFRELGLSEGSCAIYESVSGNRFLTIQYTMFDQIVCAGMTCINGNFYYFNVRDTEKDTNLLMLSYLMETLNVENTSDKGSQTIQKVQVGEITFDIPGDWERTTIDLGSGFDSACYIRRGSDGLGRFITCNAVDICSQLGINESWRSMLSGDQYTKQLAVTLGPQFGAEVDDIHEYSWGDKIYYGFVCYTNDIPGIRMLHVHNGYLYGFVFESLSEGNPFEDEYYPAYETMLSSVEY